MTERSEIMSDVTWWRQTGSSPPVRLSNFINEKNASFLSPVPGFPERRAVSDRWAWACLVWVAGGVASGSLRRGVVSFRMCVFFSVLSVFSVVALFLFTVAMRFSVTFPVVCSPCCSCGAARAPLQSRRPEGVQQEALISAFQWALHPAKHQMNTPESNKYTKYIRSYSECLSNYIASWCVIFNI